MAEEPTSVPKLAKWPVLGHKPELVNVFSLQPTTDGLIVHFGLLAPPILSGDPEHQRLQAQELDEVPIQLVASVVISSSKIQSISQSG